MKPFGVLTPIVTPCTRKGGIDIEGIRSVCKYMLDSGCAGIFVAGSTGRGPWFSLKDKAKICKAARDQIGSKVPLFVGCTGSGISDMLLNAEIMSDVGANIAVLTLPTYFNYNQNEIEYIFLKFADKCPIHIMIYDIPAFTGTKMDTRVINDLARHDKIIGFKDSSADLERFLKLISILDGVPDFYLLQGKENLLAKSILQGASGMAVSLVHITPKPFVTLYNAAASGDKELAEQQQKTIIAIMDIVVACLKRRPEISTLFHILNFVLNKRGICRNILLDHEGQCPDWLSFEATRVMEVC